MRIMVLGSDGYIGFPLTVHLLTRDHTVMGVDNFSRRTRVLEMGYDSLTPIDIPRIRDSKLKEEFGSKYVGQRNIYLGVDTGVSIKNAIASFQPDTIVHLAEQPSAAWSMASQINAHRTQLENVMGTLDLLWAMRVEAPDAHLVKLGSMGEYGTPGCDIPEGKIPSKCLGYDLGERICPMDGLMFPRTAGSFYHLSKVHDTHNVEFACRVWGLRATDIMQGVVFGLVDWCETRFDYDECFGTAINRFCVQSISGYPLTVYGDGGQTRGFLTLEDSIQCLTIAIENPPNHGEYRTLNQFQNVYRIDVLARMVSELSHNRPSNNLPNPRVEAVQHYYNPSHQTLFNLGYVPDRDIKGNIARLIKKLTPYADRVNIDKFFPHIHWR